LPKLAAYLSHRLLAYHAAAVRASRAAAPVESTRSITAYGWGGIMGVFVAFEERD
jgi:hypothetical protein